MPDTLASLAILIFALIPGLAGESVHRHLLGREDGESDWARIARVLFFSVGGLVLYVLVAGFLSFPQPEYLTASLIKNYLENPQGLPRLAGPYLGHAAGAVLVSLLAIELRKLLARFAETSPYDSAWREFTVEHVAGRWVMVSLKEGPRYAGILESADASVAPELRDVVLLQPGAWDADKEEFIALSLQHLFLPAEQIATVATFARADDERRAATGEALPVGGRRRPSQGSPQPAKKNGSGTEGEGHEQTS